MSSVGALAGVAAADAAADVCAGVAAAAPGLAFAFAALFFCPVLIFLRSILCLSLDSANSFRSATFMLTLDLNVFINFTTSLRSSLLMSSSDPL